MGAGLQIWDAAGNLTFDTADRITRIVATIAVPANTPGGTVQLPEGSPWWWVTSNYAPGAAGSSYCPAISVDANNLLSYGRNGQYGAGAADCTLTVGVY